MSRSYKRTHLLNSQIGTLYCLDVDDFYWSFYKFVSGKKSWGNSLSYAKGSTNSVTRMQTARLKSEAKKVQDYDLLNDIVKTTNNKEIQKCYRFS